MNIIQFESAEDMLKWAGPFLTDQPGLHNRPLGELHAWARIQRERPGDHFRPHILGAEHEGTPVGLVTWKPPGPASLVLDPAQREPGAAALAAFIAREIGDLGRVLAPAADLQALSEAWNPGHLAPVEMENWAYRLDQLIPPRPARGHMRPATLADQAVIAAWAEKFAGEAFVGLQIPFASFEAVGRMIAHDVYRIWEADGIPVAMAQYLRPTPTGVVIGMVYTPHAQRGRGYATNLTAAMCRERMDQGDQYLALFTNAANDTTNRIYPSLGFQFVGAVPMANFQGIPFAPSNRPK